MLAYLLVHGAGPIYLLVNFLIYAIILLIIFLILKQIAAQFGVGANIINLIGLVLFLLLVLMLFV
jgi:hypothetical protein